MTDHSVSSPSPKGAHQSTAPVIMLDEARLALSSAEGMVEILRGISLSIEAGETVGVLGPSGAGKTSLLMIMAGLESLTGGSIRLAENDITTMGEDALAALRRDQVGIVFQAFRLIPSMTALQNVAVPMELAGRRDADEMAATALEAVGLGHRKTHLPDQMSGGEQQRVAIARAIATRPRILLADEPTGNLDSGTSEKVIATLFEETKSAGAALVLVTHDANLAERCERVLTIEDGRIVGDRKTKASAA
ncbi:MAG: ABC transporter ATP-binding protein [Alphaproteobacteria bacterium]|nr:ABC transporter ATP-binding protein [Alphaproteobacteria bacterium]